MRVRLALVVLAAATALAPVSAQKADTSLPAVLAKAAEYLAEYRDQLTYVMATERTKQTLTGGYSLGGSAEMTTAADIFFVYVPADAVWMAVRDVEIVDGRVLKERDNVRALLNSGQVGAARALKDRNARYNLGTIVRNFNEPTLALTLLDDAHRTRVRFGRTGERGGKVTVSFVESAAPTLIANIDGFWEPFLKLIDHMRDMAFIRAGLSVNLLTTDKVSEILPKLRAGGLSDEQIDTIFIAVLSRHAREEELRAVKRSFDRQPDAIREQHLGNLFWVLVNSSEFNTNH